MPDCNLTHHGGKKAGSWSFASRSLMVCMGEIGAVSHHFPLAGAGTGSSGGN
ncbi:MAG: hypothetical protein NTV55_05800 [Planctomycetota bacterium]|nr:hypothetical protein [Planctomycetota bacterium]